MKKSNFDKFVDEGFNHIPVFKEIVVDTDTALGLYLKLGDKPYSYLFESVQGGEKWGRYSIIGLPASTIVKVFDYEVHIESDKRSLEKEIVEDPLTWIEEFQKQYKVPKIDVLPEFNGGMVGYFGYEIIRYIEPKLSNISKPDEIEVADILLMVSNDLVVFDNLLNKAFVITHINPKESTYEEAINNINQIKKQIGKPLTINKNVKSNINESDFVSSFGESNYKKTVEKIQQYIKAGDVMQVVPSQRLSCKFNAPPIELYRQLRRLNPSPYMYYLNLQDVVIVGSSPEILTRVDSDRIATVRPIAGTRSRGKNQKEDIELKQDLLSDEKEIAEHLMLIDLGRNDLGRIAETGTVKLTDKMFVENYSHVMHIVSNVECKLKENITPIDVLKATFPAGTLSGAPKVRAMEIIDEFEPIKRNIYSGAIGYISWHGCMDMAIAIRTAVIKNEILYVQAGAGIVYDSVPQSEWDETMHKAMALIKAAKSI